jgi:hypothetical protein
MHSPTPARSAPPPAVGVGPRPAGGRDRSRRGSHRPSGRARPRGAGVVCGPAHSQPGQAPLRPPPALSQGSVGWPGPRGRPAAPGRPLATHHRAAPTGRSPSAPGTTRRRRRSGRVGHSARSACRRGLGGRTRPARLVAPRPTRAPRPVGEQRSAASTSTAGTRARRPPSPPAHTRARSAPVLPSRGSREQAPRQGRRGGLGPAQAVHDAGGPAPGTTRVPPRGSGEGPSGRVGALSPARSAPRSTRTAGRRW